MRTKPPESVPLSKAEAEQLQQIAHERGISVDEAATLLAQAGLAGIAEPKGKGKAGKVLKLKGKGRA